MVAVARVGAPLVVAGGCGRPCVPVAVIRRLSAGDRPAAERKSRAPGSDGWQAQAAGDDRIVLTGGVRVRLSAGRAAFFFASGGRFSRNLLLILSGGRP